MQTGICYVLERTDARYLITFDADGQHSVADAAAMVAAAREEDLAILGFSVIPYPLCSYY